MLGHTVMVAGDIAAVGGVVTFKLRVASAVQLAELATVTE